MHGLVLVSDRPHLRTTRRRLRIESAPVEAQHGFRVRFSDVFFIPAEGEEKPQRYRVILHFSISYVYDKPC